MPCRVWSASLQLYRLLCHSQWPLSWDKKIKLIKTNNNKTFIAINAYFLHFKIKSDLTGNGDQQKGINEAAHLFHGCTMEKNLNRLWGFKPHPPPPFTKSTSQSSPVTTLWAGEKLVDAQRGGFHTFLTAACLRRFCEMIRLSDLSRNGQTDVFLHCVLIETANM